MKGFVETVQVPKHEDKEELLKYAYDSLDDVGKEDIKYLIPAVINALHLFNDGNGRSSRILYQLLETYGSNEEFKNKLKISLGEYGRYDSPDISPELDMVGNGKKLIF